MLEPGNRSLLLDSLRPPEGYEVDFAIATTYSLDLLSLLVAPLGFTFFELESVGQGLEDIDPMVLLRTVRRYADRISIFCQTGRIAVPPAQNLLYAHLEDSIIQVAAPNPGRSFHPKVWVIRFVSEGRPVRYRFLCLSRNLTFDRCWDVIASLEGEVIDRQRGISTSRPLADFIAELPRMATRPGSVTPRIAEYVRIAADELRRVRFDCPEGVDSVAFWPLGIPKYAKDPVTHWRADRVLAISPFVTAGAIGEIAEGTRDSILVSRFEELEKLAADDLEGFSEVFVLDDNMQQADEEAGPESQLNSLHAKCYVVDRGWDASIILGSANATNSGLKGNVEFLVELAGKRSRLGVEAILGGEEAPCFRDLLRRYEPRPAAEVDAAQQEAEELAEAARSTLSALNWRVEVAANPDGTYSVRLVPDGDITAFDPGVKVTVRPLTIPSGAQPFEAPGQSFDFGKIGLESVTAFLVFTVEATSGPARCAFSFLVRAELVGVPADRKEQLLRYHLRDPDQVLRFLLLLLSMDKDGEGTDFESSGLTGFGKSPWRSGDSEALLEPMLRALAESPAALDQVAETINELRRGDNAKVLPPGLDRIWDPIWTARGTLPAGGAS